MKICKTIKAARTYLKSVRAASKTVGLVPTMGALHAGHLSLVHKAKLKNDVVVVSVFLNPLQFGKNEDLTTYPRNFKHDEKMLFDAGVDMIFYPSVETMYSNTHSCYVNEYSVSQGLCGAKREGHFKGVATVVAKLFNIIGPDTAYFGKKDYQQFAVIKRMVDDLNFPIKLFPCPIVREKDGLAMSSRNTYLNANERVEAAKIYQTIAQAKKMIKWGKIKGIKGIKGFIEKSIGEITVMHEIDYIEVLDANTLKPVNKLSGKILIAIAVYIGKTRLIDNIVI